VPILPRQRIPDASGGQSEHLKKEKIGYVIINTVAVLAVIAIMTQDPIAQDPAYHLFADTRGILNLQNFWNIISNFPYLIVGVLGLYKVVRSSRIEILTEFRLAYILFFFAVAMVSLGSAYYHLLPDNSTLVWDRLPMTVVFMSFFTILVSEFISVKAGKVLLFPLIVAGIASVVYWHLSESWGEGDLRYYALVQFTPVIMIPVILLCFRPRYTRVYGYWWLLVTYSVAKLLEYVDVEVYQLLGFISGHSIKHIVSALGVYIFLTSFEKRSRAEK